MIDPQSIANDIRDRVVDHPTIRRLGIEVLWAAANAQRLMVRVRHRDQVLDVERAESWTRRPIPELADELAHELIGGALGTRRPMIPAPRLKVDPVQPVGLRSHGQHS
jgi:hypothetical protein